MSDALLIGGAFGLTFVLHVLALRFFPRWGFLDFPERYGLQRARLPYPTGILAPVVFLVCLLWREQASVQVLGLACGVVLLATCSFVDDRRRLSPGLRLGVQLSLGVLLFVTGTRLYSLTNPVAGLLGGAVLPLDTWVFEWPGVAALPLWSGLFTIGWIGLTTNALNWFDGIPGQTSAVSALGFLTIGLLSLSARVNQPEIAVLALVLSAIACACLCFDFPPPRVVTGDSGAMFFGFLLGVLTIYAGGKVATAFLAFGVPLTDALVVGGLRVAAGRSPFRGSAAGEHLHHLLLAHGWTPRQIVIGTTLLGVAFGGTALFLSTVEKFLAALGLLVVLLGLHLWYRRPA
jgi:UDP-GlcNAc:undecaprenyl-phosphate GlcNAc-1-phosphate transferase